MTRIEVTIFFPSTTGFAEASAWLNCRRDLIPHRLESVRRHDAEHPFAWEAQATALILHTPARLVASPARTLV